MLIALHENARATPAVSAEIAACAETACIPARRYGITEQTVYKWKKSQAFTDHSHTAHRLLTHLNPAQEVVVVHLFPPEIIKRCYGNLDNHGHRSRRQIREKRGPRVRGV